MKIIYLLIFITSVAASCQEKKGLNEENTDQVNQIIDDKNEEVINNIENSDEIQIEEVECPRIQIQEFSFKLFNSNGVDLLSTQKYNYDDISLYIEDQKNQPIALEPSINDNSILSAFYFEKHSFYSLSIKEEVYTIVLDLVMQEDSNNKGCKTFVINELTMNEQTQCIDCIKNEHIALTLN